MSQAMRPSDDDLPSTAATALDVTSSGLRCSSATADALEIPALQRVLAELAATDLGARRVLSLQPASDLTSLETRRRRFEQVQRLVLERRLVGGFERPVHDLLEQLRVGRPPMTGAGLRRLAALIAAVDEARERILALDPPAPELAERVRPLADLSSLRRKIDSMLDARGEIRENATPRLSSLRSRIRHVRDDLYGSLRGLIDDHRDHLSEDTVPMRGGRLMLVLSSGAKGKVPGLVHGRSGTGKSFYFEPLEVVETNNSLQQAVEDEDLERQRIRAELVAAALEALPDLEEHAELLGELDQLQAACRFAEQAEARLAEISTDGTLRIVAGRHPLLDPRLASLRRDALGTAGHEGEVVPLSLELRREARMLVVTGPNAGGKTVSLKSVGLLTFMTLCGLPVPARPGTCFPLLSGLVATVGDEQDLLSDRSTFSGRLLRLREAWELAGPDSLVLLDELGSGTDPEEGAALSVALLEGLIERGSLGLITTHLTPVAAAALELPDASCAAMEFDPESGEPTYRLTPGPPGGSEALALARRLGLPATWLDRADALLGTEHRRLRHLLSEVERLRVELEEERQELRTSHQEAEALRDALETERDGVRLERKAVGKRLRAELEAFRHSTRDALRKEETRLREELEAGRRKGLVSAAEQRIFEAAPDLPDVEDEVDDAPLREGGPVRHRLLGWEGTLEKLQGTRAEVIVRGKRLRCKAGELQGLRQATDKRPVATRHAVADLAADAPVVPRELKLIGQRVDPALEALDQYLDRALLASLHEVRIVHGHGSGRLREAVRRHLRKHPAVTKSRPGGPDEGGDGATVASLQGD